ncbi:MAG: hypothetical protein IPG88_25445 [Gemmatimonadetes bacterium]|nr:hypothetical protein [Gemmatimonadota bacterium]
MPQVPFPTKEERDALMLEFQRLAARLTRAGLVATRLVTPHAVAEPGAAGR